MVSNIVANYNYDRKGNVILAATPVKFDYGLDWYEFYGQDSWRLKPNLTLTYGLRWSLFPPPWELNGLQSTPLCSNPVNAAGLCSSSDLDLGQYLGENARNMRKGRGYADGPVISFGLGGPANNGPGLYHFEKTDFAPRLSLVYAPRPHSGLLKALFGEENKTVVRMGFSRVYDRAGMELINTFDQNAPAGVSATLQNPCCIPGVDDAANVPRLTSINQIPIDNSITTPITGKAPIVFFTPSYPNSFPQTPSVSGEAITWGTCRWRITKIRRPSAFGICLDNASAIDNN
jgi:outer membrane receptor protein involved in Fe transport